MDDLLLDKMERLDLIKSDIQGNEACAFIGMEKIFKKFPDVRVLMEFSLWPNNIICDVYGVLKKFQDRGYKFYVVDDEHKPNEPKSFYMRLFWEKVGRPADWTYISPHHGRVHFKQMELQNLVHEAYKQSLNAFPDILMSKTPPTDLDGKLSLWGPEFYNETTKKTDL